MMLWLRQFKSMLIWSRHDFRRYLARFGDPNYVYQPQVNGVTRGRSEQDRYQERENNQERVNRSNNHNRYETPINNLRESLYEQSLEVPIDTIRQEESNLQEPEIHEVGDIPQVSGSNIEDLRNGQMEMLRERMVSRDSYTSFSPETPERRQLHGSRRDEQTVPADHLERRRSSTSEEEIL